VKRLDDWAGGAKTAGVAVPHRVLRVELPAGAAPAEAVLEWIARSRDPHRFYWERPETGRLVAGVGAVTLFETEGAGRFSALSAWARRVFDALDCFGVNAPPGAGPHLLGGFAFADEPAPPDARGAAEWKGFAPASFALPRLTVSRVGERAWLCAATRLDAPAHHASDRDRDPQELVAAGLCALEDAAHHAAGARGPSCASEYCARPERPHTDYLGVVDEARHAVARGTLEKVVLARSLGVDSDRPYGLASVLAALRAAHPACAVFAVGRGARTFVGATPERLVELDGERVSASAVAGSAPRGCSPEEDAAFARALRESKKEQEEHAVVVREIEAGLARFCDGIEYPESPRILGLDGIQHLETPFEARLRAPAPGSAEPRAGLFDLAGALHPTPAVCGAPRDAARAWIARAEGLARGWYAGALGFVGPAGGELSVALRSGMLVGAHARLYAGAGIVADSEPRAELAETRLKLRALLSQLTEI
jgi:isochorismate synthase